MRLFLLVVSLFSFNAIASDVEWEAIGGGATYVDWYSNCGRKMADLRNSYSHPSYTRNYHSITVIQRECIAPIYSEEKPGSVFYRAYGIPIENSCPSGTTFPEYPNTSCEPEEDYCSSEQYNQDKAAAEQQCIASTPEDHNMNFNASCDADTQTANFQCDHTPINGCVGDACPNPDPGGGDTPGGGDGETPPTGDTDLPIFCRDNPDVCLYPPDDPACYDDPSLCDVPENEDLLATIRQVTEAVKDQHFNTNTVIKTNTQSTANTANDLLNVAEVNHDQLEKIASNTNSIANNTSDANALIKNNTAKIVSAIKDIESNDYSGQLSAIKSELSGIGNEIKKGFCDKNPNHESCIEKKAESSSCEKFTCTGEPVLCILLEVEHQKKCLLPDFDGIDKALTDLVSNGDPSNLLQGDALDFSNPDSKYLNGGGVNIGAFCPASESIAVLDGYLEISYRPLCDLAIMLNPLVIAMGWVVAARNVGRGISNL